MEEISTDNVASSTAPLSQAIRHGDTLYVSGQIPRTSDGEIITGSIGEQTTQVLENVEAILDAAGSSMNDVVKMTVFLTDIKHFDEFNEAYRAFFNEPFPARSAIGIAALAIEDIDIEIEAIAAV